MIEIFAVGGYDDIGKNCTAVKFNDEVIILDIGLHLENYIRLTEDRDFVSVNPKELMKVGAAPDVSSISEIKDKVKAIVIGHAHLDHVGAAPYLANNFDAPIYGTPFTMEVLQTMIRNEKDIAISNEIKSIEPNSRFSVSDDITIELIHITHSTPQTALVAIHTPEGIVLYANDFKLDDTPTFGEPPNYERIKELGNENVVALICESTYAPLKGKTPSEAVAKQMLEEVLFKPELEDNLIIVTTFSSHIARLNSIVEFGKRLNRKIIFMGRSLSKYVISAQNAELIDFREDVELVRYSKQVEKRLKKLDGSRNKYLLVMTGHQGEPQSVLSKLARGKIHFKLLPEDVIVFSCKTIPTPANIENREALEHELKHAGVTVFKDIHQSGHASAEDLREFIDMVKPKTIIPAHGVETMKSALKDIAVSMGYSDEKVYLIKDKDRRIVGG